MGIKDKVSQTLADDAGKKLYKRWYVWLFFYPAAVASYASEKYKNGQKSIALAACIAAAVFTLIIYAIEPKKEPTQVINRTPQPNKELTAISEDSQSKKELPKAPSAEQQQREERARTAQYNCDKYNRIRNECAIAGNISQCMEIKDATAAVMGPTDCTLAQMYKNSK